jgi:hypothetical protein
MFTTPRVDGSGEEASAAAPRYLLSESNSRLDLATLSSSHFGHVKFRRETRCHLASKQLATFLLEIVKTTTPCYYPGPLSVLHEGRR